MVSLMGDRDDRVKSGGHECVDTRRVVSSMMATRPKVEASRAGMWRPSRAEIFLPCFIGGLGVTAAN